MPRPKLPIRTLPSGRFQARPRVQGQVVPQTFDTYDDARRYIVSTWADADRGVWIDPRNGQMTLRQYTEEEVLPSLPGHATRERMASSFRNHVFPTLGDVPLAKLRTTRIQTTISHIDRAPGTVGLVLQHLNTVLNRAVVDGMIAKNPAQSVKLPRARPTEVRIPTPEELGAILEAIDPRYRAVVVVGAGLGLRQGEAFGLSVDRIDFLRRTVKVDRQLARMPRGSALADPKTARSFRTIPMSEEVALELARHIERFPSDDPDGLLFQSAWRARLRRDGWNRREWKPAAAAAGRPELTFHATRHFYASSLIRMGHDAVVVARRLGNTPKQVWDTYAHLWQDDDDRTRVAVDEVLGPVLTVSR